MPPFQDVWPVIAVASGASVHLLVYRLSKFPGPAAARLSNFYATTLSMKNLQLFEEVQKLHKHYGDYVRLGPSELSIADPNAIVVLNSNQSNVLKGPWYTLLEPTVPLFMARDMQEHAQRRKVWDKGFNTKALKAYESRVLKYTQQLVHAIDKRLDRPINITEWFDYYAFDVMGDLSFGKSFNMLMDGRESYFFKTIRTDMKMIAYFSHLPWLFPFFKRTPLLNTNHLKFWRWVRERIAERIAVEPEQPDVFSWILDAYHGGPMSRQDTLNLHGDAYLIVVAGSDTTSATLTNIFFHLALDQKLAKQLQNILDQLPDLEDGNLAKIDLLGAIIKEVLRLHPPTLSGTQRVTPPEGMTIGEMYVPGIVIVQAPMHTVFRDERVFESPNEFIPERWTTRRELVKDESVFIPFNAGPYACVGKRLAFIECRRVVAELLQRYDVSLAPSQTAKSFLEGKKDTFTQVAAALSLVFRRRRTQ